LKQSKPSATSSLELNKSTPSIKNKGTNSNQPEIIPLTKETLIANSQNQKNNNNTSISSKQPYQVVPQHCQFPFYGNYVLIKTNTVIFFR